MSYTEQLSTIVELVEKFIFVANTLFEKGIIDQEIYNSITENKLQFLKKYNRELRN